MVLYITKGYNINLGKESNKAHLKSLTTQKGGRKLFFSSLLFSF